MSETELVLRGNKNARIILAISELFKVSLAEATNIYFHSDTAQLIEDKIADLHCRSDKYLATLAWEDHLEGIRQASADAGSNHL
ncbi:MAG: DUF3791 domain-containing protein [Candidatus Amulumruptor caecigallinarius]|nr:DUF3791 domain-containing protein [Candidatus Amulumruptor caecigallinarius]MCM1396828.1 DUF3791 domain-containing protein [Candidatus Amulumruptor caecigallinarius]MCM1454228.1 DUF3791 domain-containing protein [bacterium]